MDVAPFFMYSDKVMLVAGSPLTQTSPLLLMNKLTINIKQGPYWKAQSTTNMSTYILYPLLCKSQLKIVEFLKNYIVLKILPL